MASNVEDMTGAGRSMDDIMAQVESLQNPERTSHSGGGGDGGMIERIIKLESGMGHVQRDVTDLRADMKDVRDRLKGLEVKVDHLPSKGFIVTAVLVALATITGLLGYQDQVQALFNGTLPD